MEVKKMFEHINDILCSRIFLISMEIIFKTYTSRDMKKALLILKTIQIVIKLVLRISNAISYLVRYKFSLLIKDLI